MVDSPGAVDSPGGFEAGACTVDRDCTHRSGAVAACGGRVCSYTCDSGYDDCDGNPDNGCEAALAATAATCGSCSIACVNPHGTTACAQGACTPTCAAGFGDCDGNPSNGCEANLNGDPAHCGSCGHACSISTGTAACESGKCSVSGCSAGLADCNADGEDGCETTLGTVSNCGGCKDSCTN